MPWFNQAPPVLNTCDTLNPWLKSVDLDEKPVIGIVSQTIDFHPDPSDHRFDNTTSYIMEAYVNFMEAAGAQVVPLIYGEDEAVTKEKLSKINGVLFPGGGGDNLAIGKRVFE